MRKRPDIVALILFVVLTGYAAGLHVFIVPVIQSLLATAGATLGWPSRASITISQTGILGFAAFIGAVVFALSRSQPKGDNAQQARVLNIASLVVTVFIVLQGWLFVDLARNGGQFSRALGRQTATATAPSGLR